MDDKLEYTTVGEWIDELSKFDRSLPVVNCEELTTRIDVKQKRIGINDSYFVYLKDDILLDPEFWKDYKNVMDCVVIC